MGRSSVPINPYFGREAFRSVYRKRGSDQGQAWHRGKATSKEEARPHFPVLASWSQMQAKEMTICRGELGWCMMLRAVWNLTEGVLHKKGTSEKEADCLAWCPGPPAPSSPTSSQAAQQTWPGPCDLKAAEAEARHPT